MPRAAVGADAHQVDRNTRFHAGLGKERIDELVAIDARGLGLEHQANRRILARLITHRVEQREHLGLDLLLIRGQRLFARLDLGIGDVLDFLKHTLPGSSRRQFMDDQLPLPARHFLELPAGPGLDRAATGLVNLRDLGRITDDLPPARKIRARHERREFIIREIRLADQRDTRRGDLAQIVCRDLGCHADRDA